MEIAVEIAMFTISPNTVIIACIIIIILRFQDGFGDVL